MLPDAQLSSSIPSQSAEAGHTERLTLNDLRLWISQSEWTCRGIFYFFLTAPLLVSGPLPDLESPLNVVWPRVHSGDEPHYLVILNSVIQDGDLDLSNNYASVHAGGIDAGRSFKGQALDHHVSWYQNGKIIYWWQVFETNPSKWSHNEQGTPVPTKQALKQSVPLPTHEYPTHPPGQAFLLAAPTYFFRGTEAVESIALLCTMCAVVIASISFEALIAPYTEGWQQRLLVTVTAFLGTPIWHYGRTLFSEPYLLCCAMAAYALALRSKLPFCAGICIGIGIWMKPPIALLAIPLGLNYLLEKKISSIVQLAIPICASVAGILWLNHAMHGSAFASSIAWSSGNIIRGAFWALFSPLHGLIPFTPVALVAIVSIPEFSRKHPDAATTFGMAFGLYFGLMAMWVSWHGASCFGPRMFIPVFPFLFIPLCTAFESAWIKSSLKSLVALYLVIGSIVFNAVGAFGCGWAWNHHPSELIINWIVGPQ